MVHKIWHASKSVANERMSDPKAISPSNFFEVGCIIRAVIGQRSLPAYKTAIGVLQKNIKQKNWTAKYRLP